MNPASPLQIGDEVEIIGPTYGNSTCPGGRFHIKQIWDHASRGLLYSHPEFPYYPASSLRKVEGELHVGDRVEIIGPAFACDASHLIGKSFEIGQMPEFCRLHLGCNSQIDHYSAAGWPMYPASSLRKLSPYEIEEHLNPELKIGDFAEVILPDNPFTGKIGRVSSIGELTVALYGMGIWSRENLRKLTPDEIQRSRFAPPINTPENQWIEGAEKRLSAIEKRQDNLVSILDRLANVVSAVELIQKEHIENHADFGDKISEVEERLLRNLPRIAELERLQKDGGELDTENNLQKGDYVEVQKDGCGKKKGFVFKITYIRTIESSICGPRTYYSANKIPMYTADELRRLSDEEICQKLNERESA